MKTWELMDLARLVGMHHLTVRHLLKLAGVDITKTAFDECDKDKLFEAAAMKQNGKSNTEIASHFETPTTPPSDAEIVEALEDQTFTVIDKLAQSQAAQAASVYRHLFGLHLARHLSQTVWEAWQPSGKFHERVGQFGSSWTGDPLPSDSSSADSRLLPSSTPVPS